MQREPEIATVTKKQVHKQIKKLLDDYFKEFEHMDGYNLYKDNSVDELVKDFILYESQKEDRKG